VACYLALVYAVVGPKLSPFHVDNPWFASMIHNAVVLGVDRDTFLDSPVSQGLAGTALFGKLYAGACAALYAVTGWSLPASQAISSLFWAVAIVFWFLVARRLGLSVKGGLLFVSMMAVAKPFVIAAMVVRPETFILLLSALAVWFALTGREALAGLVAMAAVETHPMGIVALAYLGAVGVLTRSRPAFAARLARVAAGVAAGAVGYVLLHRGHLHLLRDLVAPGGDPEMGRFFVVSYFTRPGSYYAHLTEAPLVLLGSVLAVRASIRRDYPGVAWLALAAALVAALPLRGNPHYLVLVLPALIMPIAAAADRAGRRSLALAALCLCYLPVYVTAYAINKDAASHRAWYPAAIAAAVPDDGLPVLGGVVGLQEQALSRRGARQGTPVRRPEDVLPDRQPVAVRALSPPDVQAAARRRRRRPPVPGDCPGRLPGRRRPRAAHQPLPRADAARRRHRSAADRGRGGSQS
jgi:hypothetical protein